jgi:hypothetical protein
MNQSWDMWIFILRGQCKSLTGDCHRSRIAIHPVHSRLHHPLRPTQTRRFPILSWPRVSPIYPRLPSRIVQPPASLRAHIGFSSESLEQSFTHRFHCHRNISVWRWEFMSRDRPSTFPHFQICSSFQKVNIFARRRLSPSWVPYMSCALSGKFTFQPHFERKFSSRINVGKRTKENYQKIHV